MKKLIMVLSAAFAALTATAYESSRYMDEYYNYRFWYFNRIESSDGTGDMAMIMCPKFVDANPKTFQEYYGDLVVPQTITSRNIPIVALDKGAFYMCTNVTRVTLHDGIVYIGEGAFLGCRELSRVNIPAEVTSIEPGTFWGCKRLSRLELPEAITIIGREAFVGCEKLHRIVIPRNVRSIGERAFYLSYVREAVLEGDWPQLGSQALWSLNRLIYRGDAPLDINAVSNAIPKSCALYVNPDKGWGAVPGLWNGYEVWDVRGIDEGCYSVRFDAAGGTCDQTSRMIAHGLPIGALPTPTREGYTFVGWFSERFSGHQITPDTTVDFDTTYYAHWEGEICVIDLSDGSAASSYPVTYVETMPTLTDEYKTSKLVLRRAEAGKFMMGTPVGELGTQPVEGQHEETVERPFYVGVFEITQRQWELVMGNRPSWFNNDSIYATLPVEYVMYDVVRGTAYNSDEKPAYESFLGRLARRTGLNIDLPTSGQWEYACRAGTTTAFNSGKGLASVDVWQVYHVVDANMNEVGRYAFNSGDDFKRSSTTAMAKVGSYRANAWGLYDMHGNVSEWTIDGYLHGGNLASYVFDCRSASKFKWSTDYYYHAENYPLRMGLRIVASATGLSYYVATFNANGGSCESSMVSAEFNTPIGVLPTPVRTGYTFVGWYTLPTGGEQISEDFVISSDVTFYAHWEEDIISPPLPTPDPPSPPSPDPSTEPIFVINDGELVGVYLNGATKVVVPDGVTSIGENAFRCRYELTSVIMPDSVTSIGAWAFEGCTSLTSVIIPDGVISVGDGAFSGCSVLVNVTMGKGIKSMGDSVFYCCHSLTNVSLPDGMTSIGSHAFLFCEELRTVTIPISVTHIGDGAFTSSGLTNIEIPDNVTRVGRGAFDACTDLRSVIVGQGVKRIDDYAFGGCCSLDSVMFNGDAPEMGIYVFGCDSFQCVPYNCTIKVERSSTGWGVAIPGIWNGLCIEYVESPSMTDPIIAPAPVAPGYEVIEPGDIMEAFVVPKAVVLSGAVYDDCDVVGIVELKLGKVNVKKGTGKVSGTVTTLDGKKHTIKAYNVTGIDGVTSKAVSLNVKDFGTMNVTIGGDRFAGSLGGYHVQSATVGGNWTGLGATVTVDAGDLSMFAGRVLEDFLPNDEQATVNNGKWTFYKAASVKWAKPKKDAAKPDIYDEDSQKGLIVDTSKGKTNLSGLKLTYTPKKGTYKGKFTLYALEGSGKATKLKKYTFNVTGVVVDGVGYGVATSKKPAASWAVTVR